MENETTAAATPVPSAEAQEGGQPYLETLKYTLFLTRNALRELIDNEFAYLNLLAEIDAEVRAAGIRRQAPVATDNGTPPKTDETKGGPP